MVSITQNCVKQVLIWVVAGIFTPAVLSCYAGAKPIKDPKLDKGIIFSENVFDTFRFSFIQTGHDKDSKEYDLFLLVTDSITGQSIDSYSLLHEYYGNSVYQRPTMHALKGKSGNTQILLFFRYGGDGDHLENRLHWFDFSSGSLNKFGEQNISDPEIIMDNGTLDHVKGNAVFSLCDVCDGWEVSAPEDIFFIPISISVKSRKLQITNLLGKNEKLELKERFNKQKELSLAEAISEQFDELME